MAKVKQKVSDVLELKFCGISSYLQTMATKGHNPLLAIQMALAGEGVSGYQFCNQAELDGQELLKNIYMQGTCFE